MASESSHAHWPNGKAELQRDKIRHKPPVEGFRNTDLVLMIALSWLAEQVHSLAVVLNSFYVLFLDFKDF